jgi:hypothetical protein
MNTMINSTINTAQSDTIHNTKTPQITPIERRNQKLSERLIKTFQTRGFDAHYCNNSQEAIAKTLSLIPAGSSVGWGGSDTIRSTGLIKALYEADCYTLIDRDTAPDLARRTELHRQTLLSDSFLMSANAVSEDGHLVNIDGVGNRIAALSFGPKNVIVIAGINKVVKTLEDAVSRARNTAAPINAQRFNAQTPCGTNGSCANCRTSGSLCSYIHITRLSNPAGRIKIIFVGENLGY